MVNILNTFMKRLLHLTRSQNFHSHTDQLKNSSKTNSSQTINDLYSKNVWKESENARKCTQLEYEAVRRLANNMFKQAQDEIATFPVFDMSHFRKIFSAVIDHQSLPPLRGSPFSSGRTNPIYHKNGFQSMSGKDEKSSQERYGEHRMSESSKHEMKIDKKWLRDRTGQWTRNGFLREPRNDGSYQLFGTLPKFDPRFPLDRAYKLMEGLRPSETLKFPSINSYA
ncbi:unnamed protein product [Litomosoides sigmodontis]|uniref:Uncharacterized protein n=1 Tax=Litomosoides sigmodontis TaxID=42156 RepID=A0A3P6UWY8_LITSI|nr:unnamed protein product [Litomosoides sigmodontis]